MSPNSSMNPATGPSPCTVSTRRQSVALEIIVRPIDVNSLSIGINELTELSAVGHPLLHVGLNDPETQAPLRLRPKRTRLDYRLNAVRSDQVRMRAACPMGRQSRCIRSAAHRHSTAAWRLIRLR